MALSLLSHNSAEIQSFFDPLRISLDYSFSDQMEFSALTTVNNNLQQNITSNNRNYTTTDIQQNQITNRNNFNDYEQVISFVDSPPNSKESWPGDYQKIVDVQTIYAINSGRKRRMDWEALDINQGPTNSSPSDAKAPNLGTKEREKKKLQGRGSWTDDIDFDLNGEFTNNGYLNNEAFLSLSSALTVLKQEIPSPNSDVQQQKSCKSPRENQNKAILNDDHEKKQKLDHTNNAANSGTIGSFQQVLQQQQQQQQHQQQQQQPQQQQAQQQPQQKQQNNLEHNSANNSPNHSDATKTDTSLDDYKFQYVLAAATSIATKSNEETLTYLNQGQSYEIKLKKIGDLSFYRGKVLRSIIKICFHERRLQYMEREQMQQWQASRPGERIIEVDVPLSYGLCHVSQPLNPNLLNTVEVLWDPMKEVGVYIKVNCISTEFTPKKHGGEKGVPFRIQIETYLETNNENNTTTSTTTINKAIHAAACQIKVFKLKGADRKHKQDREKIQRRPPSEQEKYQPSYECTILSDIPSDSIIPQGCYSPEYIKPTVSPLMPNSPVHIPKYDGIMQFSNNSSPAGVGNVSSSNTANYKQMDQNLVSPQQVDMEEYSTPLTTESTTIQVAQWLTYHRLNSYIGTFTHFSGSDILRMSKDDLIQICGLADGIRMFNTLHAKAITPRLTIYVSLDGNNYNIIYLISNTVKELTQKLYKLPGFYEICANGNVNTGVDGNSFSGWGLNSKYSGSGSNLYDLTKLSIYMNGPSGVQFPVTDEVLHNIKDDSLFTIEFQNNGKILMKACNNKNESN